jgi:ABC-type transport system involved in cytochrome c biogenesis permease subunit
MATADLRLSRSLAPTAGRYGVSSTTPWSLLRGLGSLKITVVMFLAAEILLLVGTLAQDEKNLPEVKAEYFNSWIAKVPLADFFPVTIFGPSRLTGWLPFPGGATIGLVLLMNLIAAKATRFQVAAHGPRLAWGSAVTLLGAALTLAVVLTGHHTDGLQGRPPLGYDAVWRLVQGGGLLLAAGLVAAAIRGPRRLVRIACGLAAAAVGVPVVLTILGGEAWRMSDPGLRIMWQLIQSSGAALVLLAGLVMVFGARGGNVLIHVAVGLLMLGQFVFGDRQIEERMNLVEGQTTSVAFRTDETELAVVDPSDPAAERVTAISARLLAARAGGPPIVAADLPFDVEVLEYFPNSNVTRIGPVAPNPATTGLGRQWLAAAQPPQGGASSKANIASAYVRIVERGTGRDLGTRLVTQFLNDQSQIFVGAGADECDTVEAGGRPWRLQLRYRREYKPYAVTLDDVRRINYSASETPRDYSSYVTFADRATKAEQKGRIWMNNPVRYRGETFYQSQYSQVDLGGGRVGEMTGLQVVENAGWLIPYVACVLAFWGMLVHFGGTFLRFADRHDRRLPAAPPAGGPPAEHRPVARRPARRDRGPGGPATTTGRGRWLAPTLALGLVAACALAAAVPRKPAADAADWRAAGELPAMHEGRIKPLDSVARTTLQLLGNRTSVTLPTGNPGPEGRVPATRWLLATMAGSDWAARAPVFRIDAKEVVDLFDLARRPGHRYSFAELEPGREALRTQMQAIREVPADQRSFVQKKYAEIEQKLMAYDLLRFSYDVPPLPPRPEGEGEEARRRVVEEVRRLVQTARMIDDNHPPAVIPPAGPAGSDAAPSGPASRWQSLYPAVTTAVVSQLVDRSAGGMPAAMNPAILAFIALLEAVDGTAAEFDTTLANFRTAIGNLPQAAAAGPRAAFEAWLNAFNPTDLAKWLYVLAVVLCFSSFLVWHGPLNRFVSALLLGTFLLHTFALAARIYLTGRPPVVNLYSSAVFIGWACVLAGMALESLNRGGIGNLVASVSGGLTLMVAYGLDSGDTMHVLQAVLDTQFWLSTHVVTVTLGYGATFLAGLLGTCAIVHRAWARLARREAPVQEAADRQIQDDLFRMTYGVVCFALFFSFIGTVLGGLWADDSWGRFWGWDPKENGALMIVLWNAAALHARWDRWIGPRGFALFSIGGNIVTAWSWFGTNQLGIGLHSYGFTSGVLMLLAGYVLSQLILIVAGAALTRPSRGAAAGGPAVAG